MRTKAMTAMKRRFVSAALAAVSALATVSATEAAHAQELQVTGPLKGAPAVRHLRLYREGRFEIAPTVSFTLLDEYRRTILVGATLNYNIKDWLAIGIWGAGGVVSETTDLASKIDAIAPRNPETVVNVNHTGGVTSTGAGDYNNIAASPSQSFNAQTAKLSYVIAPQLTFIPFRGKLAIFNKIFVDTDFYIAGGVAFVGIQERENCGGAGQIACYDPNSFTLASSTKIAPTFGVGLTFWPAGLWSLALEYRALPFSWNRSGFDSRGAGPNNDYPDGTISGADDTFKFNMLVSIALGFSFPATPKISE